MYSRQYNVRVFELQIENEQEFIEFIEKNSILLRNYLLYLKGNITEQIEDLLKRKGLHYTKNLYLPVDNRVKREFQKIPGLKIIDYIVRSGQEIREVRDILVLKRINSGSYIYTEGSFIALSLVEGDIECRGEMMLIRVSPKATVIFHDVDISEELDDKYIYRVSLDGEDIIIRKFAKEIQWV